MITTRLISTSDYAIRNVPLEISPAPSGRLNGRITAKAANDCLGCLSPSSIGKFFAHIYSDCRMFIYSFMSMGRGTTPFEIGARINEMTQFMTVIDSWRQSQFCERPIPTALAAGPQSFLSRRSKLRQ